MYFRRITGTAGTTTIRNCLSSHRRVSHTTRFMGCWSCCICRYASGIPSVMILICHKKHRVVYFIWARKFPRKLALPFAICCIFRSLASILSIYMLYTPIRDYKLEEVCPKTKTVGKEDIRAKFGAQVNLVALKKNSEGLPFPFPTQGYSSSKKDARIQWRSYPFFLQDTGYNSWMLVGHRAWLECPEQFVHHLVPVGQVRFLASGTK